MKAKGILKALCCLSLLATSVSQAADQAVVQITDSNLSQQVVLDGQKTSTIYEERQVADTCYRDVFDHYERVCRTEYDNQCGYEQRCYNRPERVCRTEYQRQCRQVRVCPNRPGTQCRNETVCNNVPRQICSSVPRRFCQNEYICRNIPRQVCENVARYRREAYACTRTVRVPVGERVDYTVQARISVNAQKSLLAGALAERLALKLENGTLVSNARSQSEHLLIESKRVSEQMSQDGRSKLIVAEFDISVHAKSELVEPFAGIQDLTIDGYLLKFTVAATELAPIMDLELKLEHSKFGPNTTLFEGLLPISSVEQSLRGNRTEIAIDLSRLELRKPLENADYRVKLQGSVSSRLRASVGNQGVEIEKLKLEVNQKIKRR